MSAEPATGPEASPGLELYLRLPSHDSSGVCKYVFRDPVADRLLEIGLYPGGRRGVVHLCFSTQWGCRMACAFCATAALVQDYKGDLSVTEAQWRQMADHILLDPANQRTLTPLREIGFDWMGMGEPGQNLGRLVHFMQTWRPPPPFADAQVLYRVNSVGIPAVIDRLAEVDVRPARMKLYISVHAVRDRVQVIPYDRIAPLPTVLDHARAFQERRPDLPVALTYLVLPGRNDAAEDACLLAHLADPRHFYIRLCNLNAVDDCPPGFNRASRADMQQFANLIRENREALHGPELRIDTFVSRGLDIELEQFQQKLIECWRGECRRDLRPAAEGAPDAPRKRYRLRPALRPPAHRGDLDNSGRFDLTGRGT